MQLNKVALLGFVELRRCKQNFYNGDMMAFKFDKYIYIYDVV